MPCRSTSVEKKVKVNRAESNITSVKKDPEKVKSRNGVQRTMLEAVWHGAEETSARLVI